MRCLMLQQASLAFRREVWMGYRGKAKACNFSCGLGLDLAHHHCLQIVLVRASHSDDPAAWVGNWMQLLGGKNSEDTLYRKGKN